MCPSLTQIGSKTAEKNSAQTNRQTDRHYENNGHLAVNQKVVWTMDCGCVQPCPPVATPLTIYRYYTSMAVQQRAKDCQHTEQIDF